MLVAKQSCLGLTGDYRVQRKSMYTGDKLFAPDDELIKYAGYRGAREISFTYYARTLID